MKIKLLKKLRKESKNLYRIHTYGGSNFWIQNFNTDTKEWYIFGNHYYYDLEVAKLELANLRRTWILSELHSNFGNKKVDELNKKLHKL